MGRNGRIGTSVAFSIGVTLASMFLVSRFPDMEIPLPYWIFGALCPGVISFIVARELVRQTEHIEELQRQREDFLQLLSHDMRAPQSSILALLDRKSNECDPALAQRIRVYAQRTLKLADDMVQLSRAQMLQFQPEELNIIDIGQEAVEALFPQAQARRIKVDHEMEHGPILVWGEPSLLTRAFVNLLDNAVKFSPDASVVRFTMTRTMLDRQQAVICSVSDVGAGIPDERLPAVYEKFESARTGGAGGAGLGLAFVKTVVTRHGGSVKCDSTVGQGTTFHVVLPTIAVAEV